jgi:hypothetical protein
VPGARLKAMGAGLVGMGKSGGGAAVPRSLRGINTALWERADVARVCLRSQQSCEIACGSDPN